MVNGCLLLMVECYIHTCIWFYQQGQSKLKGIGSYIRPMMAWTSTHFHITPHHAPFSSFVETCPKYTELRQHYKVNLLFCQSICLQKNVSQVHDLSNCGAIHKRILFKVQRNIICIHPFIHRRAGHCSLLSTTVGAIILWQQWLFVFSHRTMTTPLIWFKNSAILRLQLVS